MPQLHETGFGRKFFEAQLPALIKGVNRLAEAIEKQNELIEETKECEGPITPAAMILNNTDELPY